MLDWTLAGRDSGAPLLYVIGLALTFNLGRDITLLVAYPLIFGYVVVWCVERWLPKASRTMLAANKGN